MGKHLGDLWGWVGCLWGRMVPSPDVFGEVFGMEDLFTVRTVVDDLIQGAVMEALGLGGGLGGALMVLSEEDHGTT